MPGIPCYLTPLQQLGFCTSTELRPGLRQGNSLSFSYLSENGDSCCSACAGTESGEADAQLVLFLPACLQKETMAQVDVREKEAGSVLQSSGERPSLPQSTPQLVQGLLESSRQLPNLVLMRGTVNCYHKPELFPHTATFQYIVSGHTPANQGLVTAVHFLKVCSDKHQSL